MVIAVLAGNYYQFRAFMKEHGLSAEQAVYVREPLHTMGCYFTSVERVGTWWYQDGALELEALVMSKVQRQ